jgi:hypothetical protein
VTTPARLLFAAALCVLPLGFVWSGGVTSGYILYGDCSYTSDYYCVPDYYVAGTPYHSLVSEAPIRVFLVFAAAAFVVCAGHVRTEATRRVARAGCVSAAIAAALAAGNGSTRILLCLVGALALVVPLVAARRSESGRFGNATPTRVQ